MSLKNKISNPWRSLSWLMSHIATDDNAVRFQPIDEDQPYARVWYVKDSMAANSIMARLRNPQLTVHYRNGKTGQVKKPFNFRNRVKLRNNYNLIRAIPGRHRQKFK